MDSWDRAAFDGWLAGYERLWRTPGTTGLSELFAADVNYLPSPWRAPVVGLAALADFWERERDSADEAFTLRRQIVAVEGAVAVARIEVRYADGAAWRDLWVVQVDAQRRCVRFEEWPFSPDRADGHG